MELTPFAYGVYKSAKYLVYPYSWLVILLGLLLAALVWPNAAKRLGSIRLLAFLAFMLVVVLGNPIVAGHMVAPLEAEHPPFTGASSQRYDAIVVLGGGVFPKGTLRPSNELTLASIERTFCGVELFTRGLSSRLVFSAGDALVFEDGPEESVEMKHLAMRLGVPADAITIETQSRTTYENAVETKRLLGDTSILLVTSASHMPRALGLFRKQGFDATPVPCGYSSKEHPDRLWRNNPFDLIPQVEALRKSTMGLTERIGTWVYRILGKI
ncbi:YdcF family protein [Candidatus Nitrospira bockiana]